MKKIIAITFVAILVLGLGTLCFASVVKTLAISATVQTLTQALDITTTPITPAATCTATSVDAWGTKVAEGPIAFGNINYNSALKVFMADKYFAVDVGVLDNTNSWVITHTKTSIANGANNLDGNVNVVFEKADVVCAAIGSTTACPTLTGGKVRFADSGSKAYTKAQLAGGWLRIYYGVATGERRTTQPEKCRDAADFMAITAEKPYGLYSGSVTLTLTP